MTEQEQFERMKLFDYSAFVLRFDKIPEYPQEFAKNAFYGFYLLARCAGSLLSMQASDFSPETAARQGQQLELALSYLESECESGKKNPFLRGRPFTYEMISVLREFILLYNGSYTDSDYTSLIERLNTLVRHSETSRISQNLLRSLDIQLAKQWGRILRVYCFLLAPDSSLPTNYSYERDLHICVKRGTNRDELIYIDFLVRFHRFRKQEKVGKLILLAEEWEMRCMNKCVSGDPDKYERMVLALLDSDAFYKIGLEWVTMLILRCPGNAGFVKWEARYLRRDGKYEDAHAICEGLLKKDPKDYELYCLQSNLYFLEGNYKEAQTNGEIAASYGEKDPAAHMTLAYAYLYDGIYEDAISSFDKALALNSALTDAYRGKSKALIMDGQAYEAMECLVSISRLSPEDPEVFHDLADVYFMCGYLEECRKYCRKCLALDPECAGAYVLLGMLEIRKNHEDNAGKWLHRALEIEPQNPIALNELAYVQHMNGNDEECLRLLQRANEIAPDFPDVLCSMGVVYYYQSEFDEALEYFDRTLELDPLHVGALLGKGNLYLAQSDAEEALIWYDKALSYDPEYPEAIHGKVSAYRALGLEQEAFEWMQKASDMGIDPEDGE